MASWQGDGQDAGVSREDPIFTAGRVAGRLSALSTDLARYNEIEDEDERQSWQRCVAVELAVELHALRSIAGVVPIAKPRRRLIPDWVFGPSWRACDAERQKLKQRVRELEAALRTETVDLREELGRVRNELHDAQVERDSLGIPRSQLGGRLHGPWPDLDVLRVEDVVDIDAEDLR